MKRTKKIASAIASAAAVLSLAFFIYPTTSAATNTSYNISPTHRYILADTGTSISLSSITASLDGNTSMTGDKLTWTPADTGLTVSNGSMTASSDGVHKVTVSLASNSADVYVVTKQASATNYVLYEENFDSVADGQLPDGWARCDTTPGDSIGVQSGKLVLDGSMANGKTSVRMPSFLNVFDNYTAEADFCIAKCINNDTTRYCSLIYRMQVDETQTPATYTPCCLMTVRQHKTGDSIEMTGRPGVSSWDQASENKKDHGLTLDPNTFYKDKVSLYGNRVQEYFNDTLYIDYTGIDSYPIGGLGLLSGGTESIWDNIKITIQPENLTGLTTPTTTTNTTTTTSAPTTTTAPTTTSTTASTTTTTTESTTTTTTASTTATAPTTTDTAASTTTGGTETTTADKTTDTTKVTATTTGLPVTDKTTAGTKATGNTISTTASPDSQQNPKTGSAAIPAGLLIVAAASATVAFFNRKEK